MSSPLLQTPATGVLPETFTAGFHDPEVVKQMPFRKLGKDGRMVSLLSFGASSLAGVFRADVTEDENHKVVLAVLKSGINVIDTAPWYGFGESERILGRALKEQNIPRSAYYLHTKCCRYLPDVLEQFEFTYDRTVRSVEESLARLQVDYIDSVQVHDPEFAPSLDVVLSEVLPALNDLKKAGKIRRIGITGYPLEALRYLAENCPPEIEIDTALSYCHYNLHDQTLVTSGTLKFLADKGIGTICGSPLSMGLLTNRGPPAWHPSKPALKERCVAAAKYAADKGCDIAHLAMHYALFSSPDIATIMVSSASLARLQHDIDIVTGKCPLTAAEAQVLSEVLATFFSGPEAAAVQSWEGEEVRAYWVKLGRVVRTAWTKERARFPEKIGAASSAHSHKA
jgi:L-galactose dehydrogenase